MLKNMNLQMFAEGEPEPTVTSPAVGKTYSEDYIHTIREEAKENRIARKAEETARQAAEAKLKVILGLKPEDTVDDAKIAAHTANQQKAIMEAMAKANARLLTAEIKGLEGYDSKLVERLLDRSKVQIAEDGTVTGLKEAVEALAIEFPSIKKAAQASSSGVNPPPVGTKTVEDDYKDALAELQKHPNDSTFMQKVFLLKEKLRNK